MKHCVTEGSRFAVALLCILAISVASDAQSHFLLRSMEGGTSFPPTAGPVTFSNCVLVLPDGRFYISLRRQEIAGDPVSVSSLEGFLDDKSMRILREFLDDKSVRGTPEFVLPHIPFSAEKFETFEVQIDRGSSVQHAGYVKGWNGNGPSNPESTKRDWEAAEVVLQPLLVWSRTLKSDKYPPKRPSSKSHALQCDLADQKR